MKNRSRRMDKMAQIYDDEILPIWSKRFGRMMLRGLTLPERASVLDFGCGTGYPALEILKRMGEAGRIIAIDPAGALLDVARQKTEELSGKRIFFRSESFSGKLAFADDVYDLVVSNVSPSLLEDPKSAISEMVRVTATGGQIIATLPLAGTYREFFDIYREVLTKNDRHGALERLEQHILLLPQADAVASWLEESGAGRVEVEVEEFSLLFKSSREFFFAPVIEYGPLAIWKEVAGKGQEMQEIFWHIKEAIDAYFGDRGFGLTVKAGCVRGVKPDPDFVEEEGTIQDTIEEAVELDSGSDTDENPALEDDFRLEEETEI